MDLSRLKLQEFSEDLATACKNAANKEILSLCERSFFDELPALLKPVWDGNVQGDVVMAGVWRGGLAAYTSELFASHPQKNIYLVDTFKGFTQKPLPRYTKDLSAFEFFERCGIDFNNPGISDVRSTFSKLRVNDQQVKFVTADITSDVPVPNTKLCFLHIDLDFYQSTYAALEKFYPMLSAGGLVVVDDYGNSYFNCREAVEDYRRVNGIKSKLFTSEHSYAYWYK